MAAMRRRRMQMMMAQQQRNVHGANGNSAPRNRYNSDTSSEDNRYLMGQPVQQQRPVYNAPIGGTAPPGVSYAPPAMPNAQLSVGVRPVVDTTKGTTQIRITLASG